MSQELELKYLIGAADAQALSQLLQVYAAPAPTEQVLGNAYYDTAEHWFRQHDMGLRTRLRNGLYEQTLKLAGQQHGALQIRPEYNVPCDSAIPELHAFPVEVWPVSTHLSQIQQQLVELFRTDFTRRSWHLVLPEAEIEVVYDNGEIRAGERRQAISELEIELIKGDKLVLFELAEFLLKALPMRTGWLSKAARGYQLYQNTTTARPLDLSQLEHKQYCLLTHVQRLQQFETCYLQQLAPELLQDATQELLALAAVLTDEGQQLLASEARALARRLEEEKGLLFNSQAYHLLLLKLSKLLLLTH